MVFDSRKVSFCQQTVYDLDQVIDKVNRLVDDLGGWDSYVQAGEKVILKPNLVASVAVERNATTHPILVEALIVILKNLGSEVRVYDSPAVETAGMVGSRSGIKEVCKRHDVQFGGFRKAVLAENGDREWKIAKELEWADKVINLPKIKGHRQMYFTGGVKNLFGCVSGKRKFFLHMTIGDKNHDFARMLLDLCPTVNPCLSIADAIGAMAGPGPIKGVPVNLNVLAASSNPLALDAAFIDFLGGDVERVQYFHAVETDLERLSLSPECNWLGQKPADTGGFYFPSLEEMIPIRFNPYHTIKSFFRSLKMSFRRLGKAA